MAYKDPISVDPYKPPRPQGPVAPDPNDPNAPLPPAGTPPTPPPPGGTYGTPSPTNIPGQYYTPITYPTAAPPAPAAPLYQDTRPRPTPPTPTGDPVEDARQQQLYEALLRHWESLPPTAPGATTTTTGTPTPPTPTTPDTSAWDTGGYAKPAFTSTTFNPNAVSGYDPAKWGSASHQTPKYVVGRILSGYNLNDPTQLAAAMADVAKAYPGTTWNGKDRVTIPGIGTVDVIRDFGGESGIAWQPEEAAGAAAAPGSSALTSPLTSSFSSPIFDRDWHTSLATSGPAGTVPAPVTSGLTSTSTSGGSTASGSSALDEARRAALLDLLNRKPPTPEELAQTPENAAYRLGAQRAAERERAELAERAAASGFDNSGFMETELAGINQRRGEGEAGFLGQLAVTRMQAQREDLQFAIAQAQQAGQFDLAQALDRERMALDAAIQREQMASTEKMAANDLALREFLGRAGIDLDRLRLEEQMRQFNYDLGYRYSDLNERGRQFNEDLQFG